MHTQQNVSRVVKQLSLYFIYWVIPIQIVSNVVVITIVQNSGIAVTSSTQCVIMRRHKISPKFTQQGRIDFISKFTISNRILLIISILELS